MRSVAAVMMMVLMMLLLSSITEAARDPPAWRMEERHGLEGTYDKGKTTWSARSKDQDEVTFLPGYGKPRSKQVGTYTNVQILLNSHSVFAFVCLV